MMTVGIHIVMQGLFMPKPNIVIINCTYSLYHDEYSAQRFNIINGLNHRLYIIAITQTVDNII